MNKKFISTMTAITAVIITSILLMVLTGCGGDKATTIVVAPGYQKQFAIDAVLAVVVTDTAPEVIYFGDVKKSLGVAFIAGAAPEVVYFGDPKNPRSVVRSRGDKDMTPEQLVWTYARDRLLRDLAREIDVKNAYMAEVRQNYLITKDVVSTLDEDITIEIPDLGTRFKFDSTRAPAALVLFLSKMRIGTETDPYYLERSQVGVNTTTGRKLVYLSSFVLWDNRELKPICYGRVKSAVPITREEATIANWEEVSRNFVRKMFDPTGFVKWGGSKSRDVP